MARLKLALCVLFVAAVDLTTADPWIAFKPEPSTTLTGFPPLLDCSPAPVAHWRRQQAIVTSAPNLVSLLHDIPYVAAAAPTTGIVSAQLSRADPDRAFVRAVCFGGGANSSSSRASCRACLSAAARDATTGGCGASRRAGVWRAGCFLSYADTDALSAGEEEFRGWFYSDPDTTLEDRVCAGPGPEDCDRCFEDAARAAAALPWLVRMRREVIVVGYSCCLRVQPCVLPIPIMDDRRLGFVFMLTFTMIAEMLVVAQLLIMIFLAVREHNLSRKEIVRLLKEDGEVTIDWRWSQ